MPPAPTSNPHSKKRLRPWVYGVAVWLVVLFVLAEALMLGGSIWFRNSKVQLDTVAPHPPAAVPDVNTKSPEMPIPNLPKPEIPGRLSVAPLNEKIIREVRQLNNDAQEWRRRGEFSQAESALNQARELDPHNPLTLTNLAQLLEAMGDDARALEHWKNIIQLGAAAGQAGQLARERAVIIQQRLAVEQQARQRELARAALRRRMVIDQVLTVPAAVTNQTPEVQVNFAIRRADPKLSVNPSRMRVQLFFYDRLPDNRLTPARSLDARWVGTPADWSKSDIEVLRVNYPLARDEAGGRLRYGYLLRLYYDGELQDERAEPAELLRVFPAE
ncbi:MAG: hypothetical protein LBK60_01820 [Verrucomicrobiales bacterium]|jgi:tetratricopeptide (TPR) repeat protein|nr:hypothetical protein [Verrucomicrobiales bacterium]